jgi:glycosyltransferase A (GT-A) superfamily protein (DUF2064 family)
MVRRVRREPKKPVLALCCRCPEKEKVKARLGEDVGEVRARQFYILCLDLLQKELPLLRGVFDIAICPSREELEEWAHELFPFSDMVVPQIDGDRGEKIEATLAALRAAGYKRIVFIGSDAPSLPIPYLHVMRRLLYEKDVVLGPAQNGGVYAIGTRVPLGGLREIPWEMGDAFSALTEVAGRQGYSIGIAPPWYDVETYVDLHRAAEDLQISPSLDRRQLGLWVVDEILTRHASTGNRSLRDAD